MDNKVWCGLVDQELFCQGLGKLAFLFADRGVCINVGRKFRKDFFLTFIQMLLCSRASLFIGSEWTFRFPEQFGEKKPGAEGAEDDLPRFRMAPARPVPK